MKLMVHWQTPQDKRHDVLAAFAKMDLNDYQAQQGPGVKILGRWHDVNNFTGVAICETDDAAALGLWTLQWNAVCDFDIVPVLDDEEAHALARQAAPAS